MSNRSTYVNIAAAIHESLLRAQREDDDADDNSNARSFGVRITAELICDYFANESHSFDAQQFMRNCGF